MQLLDIPKTTRPREKLLKMGSHTLTDAELLAIMLGTGLPGQNVLQLAQALLDDFHGLAGLLQASPDDLQAAKGLGGSARRAQLLAILELSRRVLLQKKSIPAIDAKMAETPPPPSPGLPDTSK